MSPSLASAVLPLSDEQYGTQSVSAPPLETQTMAVPDGMQLYKDSVQTDLPAVLQQFVSEPFGGNAALMSAFGNGELRMMSLVRLGACQIRAR